MGFESYKQFSRTNWGMAEGNNPTLEQINTGAIQRIADACEKMCQDRESLERQVKYAREDRQRFADLLNTERRRTAALRGVIKRMKAREGGR